MRPVRLELEGFASFRDRTVVDFTDADYFALIGPTGSGKSTILDALTFALYGTAPRWGRINGIAYALAPTTNLCTVSLVFDVDNQRYQVARQVRRSGQAIQQKSVSLVRFLDSSSTGTDPDGREPEVLAGEIKEANAAIVELLGLTFDDFCQCVVLPQGEFARFLTAGVRERQQILLKLLGASQYETLQKRAGARASQAGTEVDVLTEQLSYVDAVTPATEAAARAHLSSLETLQIRAQDLASRIRAAEGRAVEATSVAAGLAADIELLAALHIPDGLTDLHASLTGATAVQRSAREAAEASAAARDLAVEAAEKGPQQATLEVVRHQYLEQDGLLRRRDEVVGRADQTAGAATDLSAQLAASAATMTELSAVLASAKDAARAAVTEHDRRRDDLRRLTAVVAPGDLTSLLAGVTELDVRYEETRSLVATARTQQAQAATDLEGAVELSLIDRVRDELVHYEQSLTDRAAATASRDDCDRAALTAEAAAATADDDLQQAIDAYDDAVTRAGAARLRPQLHVGDECPVCTQTVSTLPPPLVEDGTVRAQERRRAAELAARTAHQGVEEARTVRRRADNRWAEAETRRTRSEAVLVSLLPDRPTGDVRDPIGDRERLEQLRLDRSSRTAAIEAATRASAEAEQRSADTLAERQRVEADLSRARGTLQNTRGSLADLEPPEVDDADLAAAWSTLTGWAARQSAITAATVESARSALDRASLDETDAVGRMTAAEQAHSVAQGEHTAAVGAAGRAEAEKSALLERLSRLERELQDAPTEDRIGTLLAESERLRLAADDARRRSTGARDRHSVATEDLERIAGRASQARRVLQAARDSVAALRPVPVDLDDLLVGWTALSTWATEASSTRRISAAAAEVEATSAAGESTSLAADLRRALISHRVNPADGPEESATAAARMALAERADRDVAVAVQRAHGEVTTLERERARAADLQIRITDARTRQQVASQLAGLLRSNKFPQWLAESALDTLVAAASESLRRLSGDQFDLTHQKGEFFVIDHADADSERSVRTLSGGETFQASLALALALSEHLAGMGGSTKLESIFLDEGFGTLDPDSLEMVAGTLENLAQGERMVGVITHVAALAERAPVRFRVRRDIRTSVVEREGA